MIVLYDDVLSAECYAVRLFASLLQLDVTIRPVDVEPGREHRAPAFLERNPFGDVPLLDDDGYVLREATAILTYLASAYDPSGRWLPREPALAGRTAMWLAFAHELRASAGMARACATFALPGDVDGARATAHRQLRLLDEHLWFSLDETDGWLCPAAHPTVADVACFPLVMLAPEGDVSLLEYPSVRRWTNKVKKIPGFTAMPGIFP